ncbi:replicative DNA helicase [Bacteroidota bacterium]
MGSEVKNISNPAFSESKIKGTIGVESRIRTSLETLGNKLPPHSNEAEIAVLGSMMLDRGAVAISIELLEIESFYNEAHKKIYETMISMFERGITIDLVALAEELNKKKMLESVGGAYYLSEINSRTPTAANIETYARIVQERYLKRLLIHSAGKILANSYDETTDALDEIDQAEHEIFQIAQKRFQKSYVDIKKLAHETIELIGKLVEKGKKGLTGVPSGFYDLDKLTGGFQKSDFIVIAGRPSMGKTAFALSIARNVAVEYKQPIAFFSIEMAAIQLVIRLLSAEAKINGNNIRTGNINQKDFAKIAHTIGRIADAPIVIDDSASMTIMELRAKSRRLIAEHGVKMIMVDYLQLMRSPKSESREREISIISQSLKQLAKELNIPIVAMAQLNRGVEARSDKRPMLSDLRESGSIEQDADVVIFLHRPEQYGAKDFGRDSEDAEGKAEIILSKQRNGPTGSVKLAFLKDYARFENLAFGYQEPPSDVGATDAKALDEGGYLDNEDPF